MKKILILLLTLFFLFSCTQNQEILKNQETTNQKFFNLLENCYDELYTDFVAHIFKDEKCYSIAYTGLRYKSKDVEGNENYSIGGEFKLIVGDEKKDILMPTDEELEKWWTEYDFKYLNPHQLMIYPDISKRIAELLYKNGIIAYDFNTIIIKGLNDDLEKEFKENLGFIKRDYKDSTTKEIDYSKYENFEFKNFIPEIIKNLKELENN